MPACRRSASQLARVNGPMPIAGCRSSAMQLSTSIRPCSAENSTGLPRPAAKHDHHNHQAPSEFRFPAAWIGRLVWLVLLVIGLAMLLGTETAYGQNVVTGDVNANLRPTTEGGMPFWIRGPGFYISLPKLLLGLLVFFPWVYSCSWMSEDAQKYNLEPLKWNAITVGSFLGAGFLTLAIPIFWVGYPLLLVAYAVPLGIYVKMRNQVVPDHEQVLTAEHLRFWIAGQLAKLGVKVKVKSSEKQEPIQYKPKGGADEREDQANLLRARQMPGFDSSQELLYDAVAGQGTDIIPSRILMDLTPQHTSVRYLINGLWEQAEGMAGPAGQAVVGVLLQVAAKDPANFQIRQSGKFGFTVNRNKFEAELTCQPVRGGARASLVLTSGKKPLEGLEDLGMGPEMTQAVKELLRSPQGLFVVSAPPGMGLSTLFNSCGFSGDRYGRTWVAVEDAAQGEMPIENVEVYPYNSTQGETPTTHLTKLIRQYPDVYMVRTMPDADTLQAMLGDNIIGDSKMVVTAVRARETAEAPLRLLLLKNAQGQRVPPAQLAPFFLGSLNCRVARRLCEQCKEAYQPQEQLLARLGLRPDAVKELFRAPTPTETSKGKAKEVCKACNGRGYVGQVGIFEFLPANDRFRQVLGQSPKLDLLRAEARQSGLVSLQQDGIRLVATGITSLEEVTRVLKES